MNNRFMQVTLAGSLIFTSVSTISAKAEGLTEPIKFAVEGSDPALHPNGDVILITDQVNTEGKIYPNEMYDVHSGERIATFTSDNNTGSYQYSPEGTYMISLGDYMIVRDGNTGEYLYDLPYTWGALDFQPSNDNIVALASSSGSSNFIEQDHIAVVNLQTKDVLFEKNFEKAANTEIALHPYEPILAISHGRDVEVVNFETKETIAKISNPFALEERQSFHAIWGMSYSPDGESLFLISSAKSNQMIVLDGENEYAKKVLTSSQFINKPIEGTDDHKWVSIDTTPDGKIYTTNYDALKFYDPDSGELVSSIKSDYYTSQISFSNHPEYLAIERGKSKYHITYTQIQEFPLKEPTGNRIAFEDPFITLNTGQSTYYGMDYYFDGTKTLLDPRQVTLVSSNSEVVEVDENRKLIAVNEGSAKVTAYYRGFKETMNVHVRDEKEPNIHIDSLYDSNFYINGTAEPESTVYTWFDGMEYRSTVNRDGSFSFYLNKPLTANTKIRVMSQYQDADGDHMDEQWINVLRDTVAPGTPVVSQVNDQYDTVSGKAEPFSTIRIQLNTTTTKSVKVDEEGKYKLLIPGIKAGQNLDIKTQDRAGNLSKPKKMSVIDRTPPSMPKVNSIHNTTTKVTGTAEINASVYVIAGGKTYKSTALKGTFSIAIPQQKAGSKVSVYATDAASNKSKTAIFTVK
ncbi:hypothetical protein IHV10_10430 [Fictibacillus sp. 5RED26]|uniref:Ig-like domain-containing protein n=1 Tax=Fictibacillus sp. 5RED26 TaxID=2745876 RepID=UPI0018CF3480|nr:Ig-like domain-containing protein [Fictibacillus sp. 5RED26]MBH0156784.1 hypothetical protein [Fictibacillus sp. 5RED26]